MRKSIWTLALAFGLVLSMALPAGAAPLHDAHVGTSLKCTTSEVGLWHFVNNQTEGATGGTLSVTFSDGSNVFDNTPDKVNRNVLHWWIRGPVGELLSGSTGDVPGKLVLSDYGCVKKGS